jgi:4-amino-4-deoxy-L-arabinose transferase-like glycosyltransferase
VSQASGASRANGSSSKVAFAILTLALFLGAYLRCANLGGREMSADEGASWAAASAPTIREVLRAQNHLNPGKAGLHDLTLHLWMRAFGDGLAAMRALSAAVGTIAILLVFGATREIFEVCRRTTDDADPATVYPDEAAAITALIFAVNLITIKYSREVRMYPLVVAAVIAQTWLFFRALRHGGFASYAGVAVFTAMALAAHLTAVLAFGGEGVWIAYLIARNRFDFAATELRRALMLACALAAGAAILSPLAPTVIGSAAHAADRGAIDWIKRPAPWAPFALFNKASGSFAFPAMAALAVWGVVRGWRRSRDGISFAMLWMWTPPLMLLFVSYAIRPAFVERYLLSCFVPFFILIAVGILEVPTQAVRFGAVVLVVVLAIGHVIAWDRKPHDVQWSEAVRVAAANSKAGGAIAVAPGFAVSVVSYYMGDSSPTLAHPADATGDDPAGVALIADQGLAPESAAALEREYPRVLAHLRGVVVRGR